VISWLQNSLFTFSSYRYDTEAKQLYALPGACTAPPPFPGGWHWHERDDVKKWGAEIAKTKVRQPYTFECS
jgi:hypothetical protein